MLASLRKTFAAPATALGLMGLTVSGAAYAEPANGNGVQPVSATISMEERKQLVREASRESAAFAESGFNIGIILHVASDFSAEEVPMLKEYFRDKYQSALDAAYPDENGNVRVFAVPNPEGAASIATIDIGDTIFEVDNAKYGLPRDLDPAILDLNTADKAVDDVIKVLPTAKAVQRQNENSSPTAATFSPDHSG